MGGEEEVMMKSLQESDTITQEKSQSGGRPEGQKEVSVIRIGLIGSVINHFNQSDSELDKDGKKEIWRGKRKGVGKERKLKERWLSYD